MLGRWWAEAPGPAWASVEQMEASPWASWGNTMSFWPLKRYLLQAIRDGGFPIVCEQFDALEDIAEDPYIERHSRSMFVGIKTSAAAGAPDARTAARRSAATAARPQDSGQPVIDRDQLAAAEENRAFLDVVAGAVGGFEGKRVVEVGADHAGSLLLAIDALYGAQEAVGLNPAFPPRQIGPRSSMRQVDARDSGLDDESIDVVVSSSAFEHVHGLDEVLREMHRVLRPVGLLYSHFGPLWSTSYGHHLWVVHNGEVYTYHNTILPPWSHLLNTREEIRAMCGGVVDDVLADRIVDFVCDSPEQNRLFFDDYERLAAESPLEVVFLKGYDHAELARKYPSARSPEVLDQLAARFPERHGFLYDGITLLLRKPRG